MHAKKEQWHKMTERVASILQEVKGDNMAFYRQLIDNV